MKILVRAPNWIGDQILAYPFFYLLRKKYPEAHIVSLCSPWVKDIQYHLQVNDIIIEDKLVLRTSSLWETFQNYKKFFSEIKDKGPFDLAYVLPNSFSSGLTAYFSGALERVGYSTEWRGILLNHAHEWEEDGNKLHRAEAYLNLLGKSELPFQSVFDFFDSKPLTASEPMELGICDRFNFEGEWPEVKSERNIIKRNELLNQLNNTPYWVLAPGSTANSRQWPLEKFIEFSLKMKELKPQWKGVVVGSSKETSAAVKLSEIAGLLDWTAKGSVAALAPIFEKAKFTLCNESGLAHMASLCGSNVQIVCGAADPRRTKPIGPGIVQVSINPVPCWPCEKNECQWLEPRKNACLKGISSESILKEIESLLPV